MLKFIIIFGAILICSFIFPYFRCVILNPKNDVYYGSTDIFRYFKYKKYNVAETGVFRIYTGEFGKGKTLSAVHYCVSMYNKYNNKPVWNKELKKFVTQHVIIVSNVELSIPYVKLTSFGQFVNPPKAENGDRNVYIFLCDEFSVLANSRDYKDNFSTELLMSLLTCRHLNMSLVITSQRFNLIDKILRDNAREVIDCKKLWRLQAQYYYNGWELENCTNPTLVQPVTKTCWFVTDKDYNAYNTMAQVEVLKKKYDTHDFLTDSEILELTGDNVGDSVEKYSRKARKRKPLHKKYSS